jgi:hypothetical protein
MADMIPSRNSIFRGEMVEKPKRATIIYDAAGEPLYRCPNCGNVASADECDCIGAEPDCLFCNQCNREFEK